MKSSMCKFGLEKKLNFDIKIIYIVLKGSDNIFEYIH